MNNYKVSYGTVSMTLSANNTKQAKMSASKAFGVSMCNLDVSLAKSARF